MPQDMTVIRKGFDGLDISYPLTISDDFAQVLEECRAISEQGSGQIGGFNINGVRMQVAETGARGGYRYRCDSGCGSPFGETWFFKQPSASADAWGVRVSCKALPLALDALTAVRQRIEDTLAKLGVDYEPGTESIARVDVACDVLAPDLAPDRINFVSHSRSTVKEITDTIIHVSGRSGRVESIMIGKNPNREVVLYDKRAEVLATHKSFWWPIWDDALAAKGLPPLDGKDRRASAVWRVELRAFKTHLKDRWEVTTWADLRDKLPAMLAAMLRDVRFTTPTTDTNRARWPLHPLWVLAYEAFMQDMEDLHSMIDPAVIEELVFETRDDRLRAQVAGCLLSRAALHGVTKAQLRDYVMGSVDLIVKEWNRRPIRTGEKFQHARSRYGLPDQFDRLNGETGF